MLPDVQEGPSPTHSPTVNHMEENTGSRNDIIDPIFCAHATPGPLNPMKRTPPAIEHEGDPQLLPSQKRAKIIEAVLRESAQDSSAYQTQLTAFHEALSDSRPYDNGAPPTEFPDPIPGLARDFSRADTPDTTDTKYQEVRAEAMTLPDVNGCSQSIGSSGGKMGPSSLGGVPSSRAVDTDKTWLLHTPKRTEFERSASITSVLSSEPSPVQASKGKHRDNEGWYKEKAAVLSPGKSPPKKRYSATSVTNTLEGLSGLPIYLRTLEKDLEIKDMKIKHLENEVQRLNSRQGELEKLLQMYEQHSSTMVLSSII